MAENKAEKALKEASTNLIKLKAYYSGKVPSECGTTEFVLNAIDKEHMPWLFKCYFTNNPYSCMQFVNSTEKYHSLSRGLAEILDAVIVNTKQREALDKLVDHLLWEELGSDNSHENDYIGEICYN